MYGASYDRHTDLAIIRRYPDGRVGLLNIIRGHDDHAHRDANRAVVGWRGVYPDADITVAAADLDSCRAVNNDRDNIRVPAAV